MRMYWGLVSLALGLFAACGDDSVLIPCRRQQREVDVAQTSTLEDAQTRTGMHDAIALTLEPPRTNTRRFSAIEVLVAIPDSIFDAIPDGARLGVEIFEGVQPRDPLVKRTQNFQKSALEFSTVEIPSGTLSRERKHRQAWWRFDLEADDLKAEGTQYIVGVHWPESIDTTTDYYGEPAGLPVGYSNFNRSCQANWTIWPPGAGVVEMGVVPANEWVRNADQSGAVEMGCSWPMLRVETSVEELTADCSGE